MRNEAAKERSLSSLAADPVPACPPVAATTRPWPHGGDATAARPAGPRSSSKLATGLSTFPTESNIRVTNHLTPKTRWTFVYYYRARWYLPEAGVFGERDPLGPVNSVNLHQALGWDPQNVLDPNGLVGTLTTEYNYGIGGRKTPEGQRAWNEYFERQRQNPEVNLFKADKAALGLVFELNEVVSSLQRGDLLPAVDFTARHMFGVEPADHRRSWGVIRRLAFGIPYEGVALGDNIQFFDRGEAGIVAAIYTFDTTHHWEDGQWRENPVYGPMGFQGVEASLGIGMDYAVNIAPENNAGVSGNELTNSWSGYFHEFSLTPPGSPAGVSGFRSRLFIGVSYSVGVGLGALSLTHTYFHRKVGPVRLSSPFDAVALTMIYWQGAHNLPWVRKEINRRLGE